MVDELIKQYGSKVYALCLKLYNGDENNAKDLYQDTWLKVYCYIEKYDTNKNFLPWVGSICANTYKDKYRHKKILSFVSMKSQEEQDFFLNSIPQTQEEEKYQDVRDAIKELPEKLKICIVLYYFNGLSVEETSKCLNIPVGTVKSRLSKARKILKKELTENE